MDTNMLSTNEITHIAQSLGSAVGGFVAEIVSGVLVVAIPFVVRMWRNSRIKTAVINALVRGVEKAGDDTAFVKREIKKEASDAGVEQHLDKAVQQVTAKMADEKADAKTGH